MSGQKSLQNRKTFVVLQNPGGCMIWFSIGKLSNEISREASIKLWCIFTMGAFLEVQKIRRCSAFPKWSSGWKCKDGKPYCRPTRKTRNGSSQPRSIKIGRNEGIFVAIKSLRQVGNAKHIKFPYNFPRLERTPLYLKNAGYQWVFCWDTDAIAAITFQSVRNF